MTAPRKAKPGKPKAKRPAAQLAPNAFVLRHARAPGDILCMTSLVRDLAACRPDLDIYISTTSKDLWKNNPHIRGFDRDAPEGANRVLLDYGRYIGEAAHRPIHFIRSFYQNFFEKTKIHVPLRYPWPDYHPSPEERAHRLAGTPERYALVVSGGKMDFRTKHWAYGFHQEVVDTLSALGLPCVQAGAASGSGTPRNYHPPLRNVVDFVGKTDQRELAQLILHADVVVCTITFIMHLAAALHRPCVVHAGGREEWWWEGYVRENPGFGDALFAPVRVPHRYLHTITQLECCATKGCWISKVRRDEHAADSKDKRSCKNPVRVPSGQWVPECQLRITPRHVVEAILSYYLDGTLAMPPSMQQLQLLPPVGEHTTLTLPGGRRARLRLELEPLGLNVIDQGPPPAEAAPPRAAPHAVVPATPPPPPPAPEAAERPVLFEDAPEVGKWTGSTRPVSVCVLCYGDYPDLHRLCLDSILRTTKPAEISLRVGAAAVCDATREYLKGLAAEGKVAKVYWADDNPGKYVVMRRMFWDPDLPLDDWVVWFDDDSICNKRPDWLYQLLGHVRDGHAKGEHLYGVVYSSSVDDNMRSAIARRPWYRKRQFRDGQGRPAPNGRKIWFVTGGWWCASSKAVRDCDVPEPTLVHNGGDIILGEQFWQGGYKTRSVDRGKNLVNWSSVPRRGRSEKHWGR